MLSKTLPQAIEAEAGILGSILLDPDTWSEVEDYLEPNDFFKSSHRKIFSAIKNLISQNKTIDMVTVSSYLQEKDDLENIGGVNFLVDIVNNTISSVNVSTYVKIVHEKSLLRKIINTSTKIIDQAYSQDFNDVSSFIDQFETEILKLSHSNKVDGLTGAMEIVRSSIKKIEELHQKGRDVTGTTSGFTQLDKMTAGFHPGEMIIIAARPSMGKTAFSLNIALNSALSENKSVAFFSQEMSKEQLMIRLLAQKARINISELRVGKIPNDNWSKVIEAASTLSETNLFIDDTPNLSPLEIRAKCRRHKKQYGLDLVIIDYLQLMKLKQKIESREREVSEISSRLKALSQELQVPVIALAQLNRGVEGRSDRRPLLSDLRESGSLEQDADLIMLLYREDYYDKEDPDKIGKAELIIGKHRNGPTGNIKLKFEAKYGLFEEINPFQNIVTPPPSPPPSNVSNLRNYAPI